MKRPERGVRSRAQVQRGAAGGDGATPPPPPPPASLLLALLAAARDADRLAVASALREHLAPILPFERGALLIPEGDALRRIPVGRGSERTLVLGEAARRRLDAGRDPGGILVARSLSQRAVRPLSSGADRLGWLLLARPGKGRGPDAWSDAESALLDGVASAVGSALAIAGRLAGLPGEQARPLSGNGAARSSAAQRRRVPVGAGPLGPSMGATESIEGARTAIHKLGGLIETSRQIAGAMDGENALAVIADRAKALMRAAGCSIYKLDADGGTLRPVVSREPRFNREIMSTELEVGRGIVGSVVASGRVEAINDTYHDPRAVLVPGTPPSRHERLMVAPLSTRGRLCGAMTVTRNREPFTTDDLDLFTIFAGLAADALFAADLHREVLRTKDFLERIVDASADAIVTTDMRGRITLYSPGAEQLFGYSAAEVMGRPVHAFYARGIEEGRRIMKLLLKNERMANCEVQFVAKGGAVVDCIMAASILRDPKGRMTGTLGISKDITERVRLESRLIELTIEDDLTGLYNARHFRDSVGYEVRRSRRQGVPLALFLFDLDGFKRYNDTRGHLMGDAALKSVGRVVRASIRADIDKGFRYGGDEFVVLLPGAPVEQARVIADRIRRKVSSETQGELTISVGLAALAERMDARALVAQADRTMYRAKRAGGDRVQVA